MEALGVDIMYHVTVLFGIMQLINQTNSVQKSRKCIRGEWINYKEEDAVVIQREEDMGFTECLRMCGAYRECKTINYHEMNHTCELREEINDGELLFLKLIHYFIFYQLWILWAFLKFR